MSKNLGTALLLTQDAVKNPALDSENPHRGNRYASLHAHIDSIIPVANANGLVVTQEPCILDDGTWALRTKVIHAETMEFLESTMPLAVEKPGPQGQGSAITYARRYALASIFGVVGEHDDDANQASKSAATPPGAAEQGTAVEPSRQAPAVPNFIQKAQEAQAERKPAAPNVPVQVGTTKQGKPVYEATTHVRSVQEGRSGWWTISVVLDEGPRDLSTKLQNLIDKARQLEGTSSVVRWSEQETVKGDKTYVNRYLEDIKVADGVAETFGAAALDDDIPFAPTVF